jgi:predicted transcriptional regulator
MAKTVKVGRVELKRGRRITGSDREEVAAFLLSEYSEKKASIRGLAEQIGRSYGFVHRVLSESGVQIRPRGGDHSRRAKKAKGVK